MINYLHIKNYILIDELMIDFSSGLNAITGETGAGKSILINAIDIVFGGKVSGSVIKRGSQKAVIELCISCCKKEIQKLFEENDIEYLQETIISREITEATSRIRVNGTIVNQNFIKEIKGYVIDIHSQHQLYAYMEPKYQLMLLDNYIKDEAELEKYKVLYVEYQNILKELEKAKIEAEKSETKTDFLKFEINEIEQAGIEDINEERDIRDELRILENAERLKELTSCAYWTLNGNENSLTDIISRVKTNVYKAAEIDKGLENLQGSIEEIAELAREISAELRHYVESVENNTERFNEIQERIYIFDKLKRKYGNSLEEVMKTYERLCGELEAIENSTKKAEGLTVKGGEKLKELNIIAERISEKRREAAKRLSESVVRELENLELSKSRFEIKIEEAELSLNGKDNVEFYISTNISGELEPIAKVASGGELSRIILALKTIFAEADDIDTIIFDEIDTGISGKASQSVADKIHKLSKYRQILLITHQAVIASKAENHILVTKKQDRETSIIVKNLNEEEKISAIANLASGDNSIFAREFAKSLLAEKNE